MSTNQRRSKRRMRGSVLLLAIFFLIVLFSLSVAFFKIIPAEYHSANQARRLIQAQYAADAGVRKARAWLEQQTIATDAMMATFSSANSDPDLAANKIDDNWSFTVALEPSSASNLLYNVVSTSYFNGRAIREIRATVQNESFAKYALFYDTWNSDFLFSLGSNGVQGPFHTNGFFRMLPPSGFFNTAANTKAFVSGPLAQMTYSDQFLGSGDGQLYYGGNNTGAPNAANLPYDPNSDNVAIAARYNKIVEGGRDKLRYTSKIELPKANSALRQKAWGGTVPTNFSTIVSQKGPVLVNTTGGPNTSGGELSGGIFIRNDATSVRLEITPEGHQKTRVRHGDETVAGGTTTWWKNDPVYRKWIQPPSYDEDVWECTSPTTKKEDVYENLPCNKTATGPSAQYCGTTTKVVTSSNGVTSTLEVPNICTYEYPSTCNTKTGTRDVWDCAKWSVTGKRTVTPAGYWQQPVDAGTDGAVQYTTTKVSANAGDPGAYAQADTVKIENWNSVVEVNDANYKIPWQAGGVKVDGVLITDPTNSVFTTGIADGNTVSIRHDVVKDGKNFAEYTVMKGRANGVTFSDGHLSDLKGVTKGAKHKDANGLLDYHGRTIATDILANKRVDLSGDLLQYYGGNGHDENGVPLNDGSNRLRVGNKSPNDQHILGIVAYDINIKPPNDSKNWTGSNAMDIYGVLMAGRLDDKKTPNPADDVTLGGFGSDSSAMGDNDGMGQFNLYGGIISGNARKTTNGVINATTGVSKSNGFGLGLNYDPIAAMNLEDFPVTNKYTLARYVNVAVGEFFTQE